MSISLVAFCIQGSSRIYWVLPFELLYGRQVRGPLDILREVWTEGEPGKTPRLHTWSR